MTKIYIIHENPQWFAPLAKVFKEEGLPYGEIYVGEAPPDMSAAPPEGVYFSKMSASAYTRGHDKAHEYTFEVFKWLAKHGRRIINGTEVLKLELSKAEQMKKLEAAGIKTPRTVACKGKEEIKNAAKDFSTPFILKPDCGGKGLGVKLIESHKMLEDLTGDDLEKNMLVQEYIKAPEPFITRMEFISSKFVYAVKVDTSEGFELCPAEACRVGEPKAAAEVCAIDAGEGLFRIMKDFADPLIEKLEKFLAKNKIEVAGIEFIRDANGNAYVYDINTNTNYNPEAEAKAGISAIKVLTDFLRGELEGKKRRAG